MTIFDDYFNYCDKWKKIYGEKTYILMEVGSFFEIYGLMDSEGVISGNDMDALEKMANLTANVKEKSFHDGKKIIMAGFMPAQFNKFTRFVYDYDYTLVIYKQIKEGDGFTRVFSDIISPGSVFEDDGTSISNVTLCLWVEYVKPMKFVEECVVLGISTLDIFTGITTMHEITQPFKHEPNTYDEIEKLVSIYRPREAIVISNLEYDVINEIVSFVGLDNCKNYVINYTDSEYLLSKYIENAHKQTYQKAAINKYYPEMSDEYIITDIIQKYCISLQSFVVLLDYMYEHNCDFTNKLKFPEFKHETNKLVLANHSLKQLNILDDNRHKGKYKSVSSFLNNCKTNMGVRKFQYDLHNPINNIDVLNEVYHMTDNIIDNGEWKQYRESLSNIIDLDKFKRALLMKKTSPKMFAKLFSNLTIILDLANNSRVNNAEVYEYATRNGDPISNGTTLMNKLHETFNIEIAATVSEVSTENLSTLSISRLHFINPEVSPAIDSALDKYHDCLAIRDTIQIYLNSIICKSEKKSKNTDYIKISTQLKTDPYFFSTIRRCNFLKNNIDTLAPDDKIIKIKYKDSSEIEKDYLLYLEQITFVNKNSSKSDKIITSPQIKQVMSNIQQSLDNIISVVTSFYKELLEDFISYTECIDVVCSYVENIDVLQNKAYIATKYNYCRPVIEEGAEKSFCDFTSIRHPLIEHIQTNELYVTNDLCIGKDGDEFDGLLLYGTNAVGKTSLIRSIGIAIIMAQSGLYVPCKSFVFYPYDYIFTRILGNDNLFKGLSTFAVEMCELRTILTMATKNSIILGDELCSGTESNSALSIFTTGLEILNNINCTFLFATHFHEITEYEEIRNLSNLKMMHMEVVYDSENDCLVYNRKLQSGPGDSMYGLEVCKSLGLPDNFIERAINIRLKYNPEARGVLSQNNSRYNSKKIRDMCEMCGEKIGVDIHHLIYKSGANKDTGYIGDFNKNHPANLSNVCKLCHDKIHESETEYRKTKTTKGSKLRKV